MPRETNIFGILHCSNSSPFVKNTEGKKTMHTQIDFKLHLLKTALPKNSKAEEGLVSHAV